MRHARKTGFFLVLGLVLAFAPGVAAAGGRPLPSTAPVTTPMQNIVIQEIIPSPGLSPALDASIILENARIAQHDQLGQLLQQQQQTENNAISTLNDQVAANNQKIDALNQQKAALQEQIDAHNAQPHTFQIPDQQAEADAYDAEAAQLNSQLAALNAQIDQVNGTESDLENQAQQIEDAVAQLSERIQSFETEAEQLAAARQQLLQQIMSALQAALQAQTQPAQQETPAGGDAGSPADQNADAVPPQDDGGDSPSQSGDNAALDDYARNNGVQVEQQPVRVLLTPGTVSRLSPGQTEQLAPDWTYDALVPQLDGTYKALELQPAGTTLSPENQAFNNAISQGGEATAIVNGQPATITRVQTVPEPAPAPAPKPPAAPAVDPRILQLTSLLDSPGTRQQGTLTVNGLDGDQLPDGFYVLRPWLGNDPGGKTQPRPRPGGCAYNWQDYGPREPSSYDDASGHHVGDRATGAEACVKTVNTSPRPRLRFSLFGMLSDEDMSRCHLIARSLNGSDTDLDNFAPCYQDPTNNEWMWGTFESEIYAQVVAGNPVYMVVRPVYNSDAPWPAGFLAFASGNNGWICDDFIPNVTATQAASDGITIGGC